MPAFQKLPSGTWRVLVYVTNPDGSKTRKSLTAPTRWQAEKLAAEYSESSEHMTVGEAVDGYIDLKKNVLSPSTLYGYGIIRRRRLQSIMDIDIKKLNSVMMQRAVNEDAAHIGRKSISDAVHLVVSAMALFGVKVDLKITLPPKKPRIKNLPTPQQVIKMVRGSDVELPCLLALWLSLRISEVRGLQFSDLKDGVLTVQRSRLRLGSTDIVRDVNKTYKSTRRLAVPDYLIHLILAVPHERDDEFICPQHYQTITKHFKKLCDKHGYTMSFHDLRHLNASLMLALGVPDKYAMERGGWATNATLKSVYQHTFSDERRRVDEQIDSFFNALLEEETTTPEE